MRMSDIIAALDLTVFPIIGLALFGSVFIAVTIKALATSRASNERWANIPLESDTAEEGR